MSEVVVDREGSVVRVTMNRPDARNGMTVQMLDELVTALHELATDTAVRVVVLSGAGRDFSVGADLTAMGRSQDSGERAEGLADERIWRSYQIPVILHEMPQITIAAVDGACAGAAFGIACACDLRIASERSIFRTAFLRVGVAGDMAGAWTVERLIGAARARELFLLNERISAESAYQMGLVTKVFPDPDFKRERDELVAGLAHAAPLALTAIKANALDAERMSLAEYSEEESRRHMQLLATQDVAEAAVAFVTHREPVFRGR
jgi:2-(1,2-epoxy-1,2-dihydrophenyl)acetyl-CoA isomerase